MTLEEERFARIAAEDALENNDFRKCVDCGDWFDQGELEMGGDDEWRCDDCHDKQIEADMERGD